MWNPVRLEPSNPKFTIINCKLINSNWRKMGIYNNIGILFKCVLLDANGWWWDYRERKLYCLNSLGDSHEIGNYYFWKCKPRKN